MDSLEKNNDDKLISQKYKRESRESDFVKSNYWRRKTSHLLY